MSDIPVLKQKSLDNFAEIAISLIEGTPAIGQEVKRCQMRKHHGALRKRA
jgi:hypothetical protein